ncbi:GntR family transcriptional regulator [Anaerocolumna cellulosilytica]|uniref:GntR family transcriptional regulator n=1 Tax=Anaerocolumna cellulosilytica TaxID=433286 RepID=A0A6S6R8M9_9FIRM|nr:GntR family transcriptional regulator [Anaerocolumna cellulosilytica]MBB5197098.1 DNA-binding transcriptional regulator YhcF (GntR family) [Anaerocolumna cellulosilytica]BCJ95311.1 GntR family transcriptional regulator [Anaerocolumna cellulosilytica]
MQWELNSERPVYIQLIEQIQSRIITGVYLPGDKLPSVRDLAAEAGVNPNTMQKALTELERIELVYANRTSGRYITLDQELIKQLKKQSAKQHIQDFLEKMNQLGYEINEIISLIPDIASDMKKMT